MKLLFHLAVLAVVVTSASYAEDASRDDPSAIRSRVWSRYLSPSEQTMLTAMIASMAGEDPLAGLPPEQKIVAVREGFRAMAATMAPSRDASLFTQVEKGAVKGVWYRPENADQERVLLYTHGGGFIVGDPMTSSPITVYLAEAAGISCFSLDYPLAPENPYPTAHDNALAAYQMLLDDGYKPENIVLAGDSAGGNLALSTLLRARDEGLPLPAGAYLLSPWTDVSDSQPSREIKESIDALIKPSDTAMMSSSYAQGHDLRDPALSPLFADPTGLPPLRIDVGSHETLLDDSIFFARNAALADVPVTLTVWPGYAHVFQFAQVTSEGGRKALEDAARFLREALDGSVLRK